MAIASFRGGRAAPRRFRFLRNFSYMEHIGLSVDSSEALARDIGAIARIGGVPSMLQMICDETGMGFAAVARVTDATWTACAVQDNIGFGLKTGGHLDLHTTLCFESRVARAPIIVDRFSDDVSYKGHHTPAIYRLESYISVPIITPSGEYFGNLCAIDPRPAKVSEPRVVRMFEVFANLIAMQLDSEQRQWTTEAALKDERATANLREQFIAVLGHDLRNPLSAVNATAEMLVRGLPDADLVGAGHRLKRTVQRMTRLIDDVMDFARGRLGSGMTASIQLVDDPTESLRSVVDELRDANPSRKIDVNFKIDRPVNCDVNRIQQLLSNLLGNALTYGAVDLPASVSVSVDANSMTLSVTNGGDPIPPHMLAKVFEPYWRPPSSTPGGGLGLGLYICKQIVEAHQGTLEVCSNITDGTCFTAKILA
ncbi:signal transduction histidine kinase [Paraburkholderia sp. GAS333]|uniref:GAF domain-containing sensor histidine kinase n=1 Tax=Paraburkholderia sp. GAS333 TaxID=3156279 RepID=UPI003D23DB1A